MIENTTTGSGHHHGYRLNISIPHVLEIFSRGGFVRDDILNQEEREINLDLK